MKLVIVESPFMAHAPAITALNLQYARAAMRDCFMRGESPYASHLLFTQPGILDDNNPEERAMGIEAGLLWGKHAKASVVYYDLGLSEGMKMGIDRARKEGREIRWRMFSDGDGKHSHELHSEGGTPLPPQCVPKRPGHIDDEDVRRIRRIMNFL